MKWVRTLPALRDWIQKRKKAGELLCLVPTMGCLHEGHLALIRKARQLAGPKGKVAVSIYVNPTQFGPKEDLRRYPRTLAQDRRLCRAEGVDLVFLPEDRLMYPRGKAGQSFSTFVVEEHLSQVMEGQARPGHFRGVATVVAKLFNMVQPDVAVFGAKDFQQSVVVKRMARDLNFPVRVVTVPTVREPDGLALSSRNRYLSPAERAEATRLIRALREGRRLVRAKSPRQPWSCALLKKRLTAMFQGVRGVRLDYMEFFDPATLEPVVRVLPGTQMALAVYVGSTRLIDNARL